MGLNKSYTKEKSARKWYLVDLKGQTLGRAASKIAMILRGKTKATFTPHEDVGDFVVAINAKSVRLTGNKLRDKIYYHHSGYIGGIKEFSAERLLQRKPEELIYRAVKGMLPKTHLAKHQLKKLKIYMGAEHPHLAQRPEIIDMKTKGSN
jgi:large subunit ribosomal protein L13